MATAATETGENSNFGLLGARSLFMGGGLRSPNLPSTLNLKTAAGLLLQKLKGLVEMMRGRDSRGLALIALENCRPLILKPYQYELAFAERT